MDVIILIEFYRLGFLIIKLNRIFSGVIFTVMNILYDKTMIHLFLGMALHVTGIYSYDMILYTHC